MLERGGVGVWLPTTAATAAAALLMDAGGPSPGRAIAAEVSVTVVASVANTVGIGGVRNIGIAYFVGCAGGLHTLGVARECGSCGGARAKSPF